MRVRSAVVIMTISAMPCVAQDVHYSLTDLRTLGGADSEGAAVNSAGQVTGVSFTAEGAQHAFLYSNGTMQDLGTFGGTDSGGLGINSAGQVTGFASLAGDAGAHAFLYSDGTMHDLGTLGGNGSSGFGINDSGQVSGTADTPGQLVHAFLFSGGTMQDLGTLGGTSSFGRGINSAGQVTGFAYKTGNTVPNRAFLYSNGTMQDLGTLGGETAIGNAINSGGQVTGWASVTGWYPTHAFLYRNGTMQDLGTLGGTDSYGFGINAAGEVTGMAYTADGNAHAFIYSNARMTDLNTLIDPSDPLASFVSLHGAVGISDNGFIVADGIDSRTRNTHAYLLTPIRPDLTVVSLTHSPETPATQSPVTFTAVVKNIGTGHAPPSTLSFRVGGETPPGRTFAVPALAPDESFTASRQETLSIAQNYRNTVVVDVNNDVSEVDEANNERADDYTVVPAVCRNGDQRNLRCAVGGRPGVRHDVCVGGLWRRGSCIVTPECIEGERRLVSCRLDGRWGAQHEVCRSGRWRKAGACMRHGLWPPN